MIADMRYTDECKKNTVNLCDSICIALQMLNNTDVKVLFVIDEKCRVVASVTDGDIRRALVQGKKMDTTLNEIAHFSPVVIAEDEAENVSELAQEMKISAVPVLNQSGELVRIYYDDSHIRERISEKIDAPLVITAGGKGTRLLPYTKILPKPLIPVAGVPIIERIIDRHIMYGCNMVYAIVNYRKNMIKAYFSDSKYDIAVNFVDELIALGTGGGLRLLSEQIMSTFIFTNCDILVLEDVAKMFNYHKKKKNAVTVVCARKDYQIPYGVVKKDADGRVLAFEEKPRLNFYTNTGYYIMEPSVMDYIGKDENIGAPDILERMREDGLQIGVYAIDDSQWLDMGQFDAMDSMERRIKEMGI